MILVSFLATKPLWLSFISNFRISQTFFPSAFFKRNNPGLLTAGGKKYASAAEYATSELLNVFGYNAYDKAQPVELERGGLRRCSSVVLRGHSRFFAAVVGGGGAPYSDRKSVV